MAKLDLATLIDLEAQLARDADRTPERLEDRDAAIAQEIQAAKLDGVPLYLAWWDALRKREYGDRPTPGQRIAALQEAVAVGLALGGVVLGFVSMWGYLVAVTASGWPVNVIHFVALFVGVQWLLLLLWLVLVLPFQLPGARGVYLLLEAVEAWLPKLLHRIGGVVEHTRRVGRLHARLRLWWISRVTQGFALALNLGFVLGFVAASVLSDPSFGWRSTLLDGEQVHQASRVLALPWSWALPGAGVLESEVYETRFSSLDADRFTMHALPVVERPAWRVWWWFLCVALLVYGVGPRVATWLVSGWGVRRQLRRARLDHAAFAMLRDRLKRPGRRAAVREERGYLIEADPVVEELALLRWSGAGEDEAAAALSRERLGVRVVGVRRVGGMDVGEDDAALRWAAEQQRDVGVVVEGWEPPVAEYLDLLRKLRQTMGDARQIVVLVAGDAMGSPTVRQMTLWADALRMLRDPRLRAVALVRGEGVA